MKKDNLNKRLYNAYQKGGASAVYDIANKLKLPYSFCKACDCETPTITHITSVCGVCGTVKREPTNNTDKRVTFPKLKGGEQFLMTGFMKFIPFGKKKERKITATNHADPNYPAINVTVDGELAAIVEFDTTTNEFRILTYTSGDPDQEPAIQIFKKLK